MNRRWRFREVNPLAQDHTAKGNRAQVSRASEALQVGPTTSREGADREESRYTAITPVSPRRPPVSVRKPKCFLLAQSQLSEGQGPTATPAVWLQGLQRDRSCAIGGKQPQCTGVIAAGLQLPQKCFLLPLLCQPHLALCARRAGSILPPGQGEGSRRAPPSVRVSLTALAGWGGRVTASPGRQSPPKDRLPLRPH